MAENSLSITIEGLKEFTYVNYQAEMELKRVSGNNRQNAFSFLRSVTVENKSAVDIREVDLLISSSFPGIEIAPVHLSLLEQGKKTLIASFSIFVKALELYSLSEAVEETLSFEIVDAGGNVLSSKAYGLKLMPIEESASEMRIPEILASFVTPNDDEVRKIVAAAAEELREKTGRDGFYGYQYHDPNMVYEELDALYRALEKQGIRYSNPPTSFEKTFQRVRLPYQVLTQKVATCLDFSLLYASMCESIGLRPLIIVLRSHAMVGVWLDEDSSAAPYEENGSYLVTAASKGFEHLSVIDVTMAHSSYIAPFDQAVSEGYATLSVEARFRYALDINMCRKEHLLPIPTPHKVKEEVKVDLPSFEIEDDYGTPKVDESARRYISGDDRGDKNRFDHWLEKLLDLNLGNRLINLRFGSGLVQFVVPDAEAMVKELSARNRMSVVPLQFGAMNVIDAEKILTFSPQAYGKLSEEAYKKGQILATVKSGDVESYFKSLTRKANTALEESGSNPLFLTLGMLKWFDNEHAASVGKGAMYAPVFLLPISLPRRKSANYYSFSYDLDELGLNTTLFEYLREAFGMDFTPISGSMRTRDDGLPDLRLIYNFIREKISQKKGWMLYENVSTAGLFGFAHFVMWNDLRTRKKELLANPFIASFVSGEKKWEEKTGLVEQREIDEKIRPGDLALPLPADSSQIKAISDALNGESFIMDGPPGTGKSQTIANMIVNFLFHGKSVLFVAEKEVALDVVKNRLDELGLGRFCLQLSSVKTSKSEVLKSISSLLDLGPLKGAEDYAGKSNLLEEKRAKLNSLLERLHTPEGYFVSIYDAILLYLSSLDGKGLFEVDEEYVRGLTKEKYEETVKAIEKVAAYSNLNRGYLENPFVPYQKRDYSLLDREALPKAIKPLVELDREIALDLYNCLRKLPGLYTTRKNASLFVDITNILSGSENLLVDKLGSDVFLDAEDTLRKYLKLNKEICALKNGLARDFEPQVYSVDIEELASLKEEYAASSVFKRGKSLRTIQTTLKEYYFGKGKPGKKLVLSTVEALRCIDSLQKQAENLGSYPRYVFQSLPGEAGAYEAVEKGYEDSIKLGKLLREMDASKNVDFDRIADVLAKAGGDYAKVYEQNDRKLRRHLSERSFIKTQLKANLGFDLDRYPDEREYFKKEAQKVSSLIANEGLLGGWVKFLGVLDEAKSICPNGLVEAYQEGLIEGRLLEDAYVNALCYKAVAYASKDQGVETLSGEEVLKFIEGYGADLKELEWLSVVETASRITSSYPLISENLAATTEVYQLKKLARNGGRGVSLRNIFVTYGGLIHKLCPCFLMSPLSVAQFLQEGDRFDAVIFDEASQIPTSEAVGAISRGNSLVIAGDQQQMPPSNYFAANVSGSIEGGDYFHSLDEDLESLLDDAIVMGLKRNRLNWHYRSRHESLIAYSNNQFYGNSLLTFPSPEKERQSVSFRYVKGRYEKGRGVNRDEAKAVVNEIVRRLKDPEKRKLSIGVVTFNEAQQNLIMDLLEKEEAKLRGLDPNPGGESIFVKNLENVQGDERDVILFSVTYGPDPKTGNLSLNFGPLSRDKGERRLNVAVTRAREEMIVFSSILPAMIQAERAKNEGARYLRDFLSFASEGTSYLPNLQGNAVYERRDSVAKYLAEDLRKLGYSVVTDLGTSVFRLDLAVNDPDDPEKYSLGILLDGPSYVDTPTSRDRNLVQPSILKGLRWRLMRFWSIEYFDHPDQVVRAIVAKINEPVDPDEFGSATGGPVTFARKEITLYPNQIPYDYADMNLPSASAEEVRVFEGVKRLIDREGPISRRMVMEKVKEAVGQKRLGAKFRSEVELALGDTPKVTEICGSEPFYYPSGFVPESWPYYRVEKIGKDDAKKRRDLTDISYIELSNAFSDIIFAQGRMSADDLVKQTALMFGVETISDKRKKYVKAALKAAIDNRHGLKMDDDGFVYVS